MCQRPRVLVIDDIAENIQVLGEHLSQAYEVHYALSGQEALALIEDTLPDLILLDVMMPGMDGYAVCDALKRHSRTREVPILFVTARNDPDSESRAFAAGAVDFIPKPVNREVVQARVALHLRLRARERELNELNAELGARVAERTQDLADALRREQVANHAKSLFLANVNHELRTPMNAILGLSGLLASDVAEPRLRERVAKIGRAGQQLLRIVDDVIDMADIQAGRMVIGSVAFDLFTVLAPVVTHWRERAEARGLELVESCEPGLPPVLLGDPDRLAQILGNLLGNAVKFSEQGRIALRVRQAERNAKRCRVRFEVEDQGIGIDRQRQPHVFEVFEQADNSRTRHYGGMGLGLTICKHLTALMGGDIGFTSEPGRGSVFWTSIPFETDSAGAAAPSVRRMSATRTADALAASGPDLFQLLQIFTPITEQLAANDVQAYLTWERGRALLDAALGQQAGGFAAAMQAFDFSTALEYLTAARETIPELAVAGRNLQR